jgi:capsular polysaccharide biosynthesis protein
MSELVGRANGSPSGDAPATLAYYARLVLRRWWLPVSFSVLGVSLALLYTGLQSVAYEARSTILLSPLDPGTADELPRLAPTVARLVRSDAILLEARRSYVDAASDRARSPTLDVLRGRTSIHVPRDTSLFEVTARGPSQQDANRLVRALVGAATSQIARLGGTQGGRKNGTPELRVAVLGPPIAVGKVSPTAVRNLVLGANLGLLLGIAAALLVRDPLRARVRADVLAELLDASNVVYAPLPPRIAGQLPRPSTAVPARVDSEPADRHAEGIRVLSGRIWQWFQHDRRVVLLVGDLSPQTLRAVALRLAGHLAGTGLHPVVLEADFHGTGWRTERGDEPGLGDVLVEEGEDREPELLLVEASSQNGSGPARIMLVPRGQAHGDPAVLFASDRYRSLIERFVSRDNLVLVVGPPTGFQAEVLALADWSDGVILLVPPWIAHSHAASMTTLRSIGGSTSLLVSVFGEPEDLPLAAGRERTARVSSR